MFLKTKSMRVKVGIGILFIATAVLALALWSHDSQKGVVKLLMPGTYEVNLPSGTYAVWFFQNWPTKGIVGANADNNVDMTEVASGKPIERLKWPPPAYYDQFFLNTGREQFDFILKVAKTVRIVCEAKCVVVIVPAKNYYHSIDRDEFTGIYDDFNFIAPKQGKHP